MTLAAEGEGHTSLSLRVVIEYLVVGMEADPISCMLSSYRVIAVVGLSRDPSKYSYAFAEYLKSKGYRIIPIDPFAEEILGERCHESLLAMPEDLQRTLEIVDIFRPL